MNVTARIVRLTPDACAKLLERNIRNRDERKANQKKINRAIREGRFELNGETIKVDLNGNLLDGAHRLRGCVETGLPIDVILVEGLRAAAQDTVDIGAGRSGRDQLQIEGHANSAVLAGATRQIYGYLEGTGQGATLDVQQIKAFVAANPDLTEIATIGLRSRDIVGPSVMAAVLWLGSRSASNRPLVESFGAPLNNGEGLASGDPRLALRNLMIGLRLKKAHAPKAEYSIALVSHAWNAFVSGRIVTHLKVSPNSKGRFIQPPILGAPPPGSGLAFDEGSLVARHGRNQARQ